MPTLVVLVVAALAIVLATVLGGLLAWSVCGIVVGLSAAFRDHQPSGGRHA